MQNADLIYVIGRIYDAALDPDLWSEVIGQIAALTGRHQGCLETLDYRTREGRIFGHAGYDVHAAVANPAFLAHDHWAPRIDPSFCGDFVLGHELLPEADRRKTAFANELAPGVGMATYDVCALIARRLPDTPIAEAFGGLLIYSDEKEGHFSDKDMAVMAALQPHILRALHIQGEIEFARTTASLQDELLNTMRTACWLVDTRGQPQYANAKAERLEARGEIRRRDGRLAARDRSADRWLQKRLHAWRTQATLVGDKDSFVYYRDADERPQFLTVMPVAPERVNPLMPGQPIRPCLLVAVSDQQPDLDSNVDTVARAFELTPAEAEVLALFARGANPQRIADHTNKRLATVRTQFNSVLSKTGTASQAELLALVHNTV
ncbi:LuxR family transcriptional regulator [Salinisphaera shabanensis T35B1]|uniref:helix-turn-helix transcriptional regulator n=1 Tax=Salinisphaera shabanensis TaxID=180542 RepID=UPI00334283F4